VHEQQQVNSDLALLEAIATRPPGAAFNAPSSALLSSQLQQLCTGIGTHDLNAQQSNWLSAYTDNVAYTGQLWEAMIEDTFLPMSTRKMNDIVPVFLQFVSHEYDVVFPQDSEDEDTSRSSSSVVSGAKKIANQKLILFLRWFAAAVKSPNHLKQEKQVQQLILRYVACDVLFCVYDDG